MHKHVLVISHRRSGTHLTIDAIGNNSARYRGGHSKHGLVNLDRALKRSAAYRPLDEIEEELSHGPRIVKTHAALPWDRFFGEDPRVQRLARDVFESSHKVYVRRSPLDVLWSLYNYQSAWDPDVLSRPVSAYIRELNQFDVAAYDGDMGRAAYLGYHVSEWSKYPDLIHVSFEDLALRGRRTVRKLLSKLGEKPDRAITDVYQKPWHRFVLKNRNAPILGWLALRIYWRCVPDSDRTAVLLGKGGVGKGFAHFSREDIQFIRKEMGAHFYLPRRGWRPACKAPSL